MTNSGGDLRLILGLKLRNLRPTILELFEVMRLTQVFDIEEVESEAVQ